MGVKIIGWVGEFQMNIDQRPIESFSVATADDIVTLRSALKQLFELVCGRLQKMPMHLASWNSVTEHNPDSGQFGYTIRGEHFKAPLISIPQIEDQIKASTEYARLLGIVETRAGLRDLFLIGGNGFPIESKADKESFFWQNCCTLFGKYFASHREPSFDEVQFDRLFNQIRSELQHKARFQVLLGFMSDVTVTKPIVLFPGITIKPLTVKEKEWWINLPSYGGHRYQYMQAKSAIEIRFEISRVNVSGMPPPHSLDEVQAVIRLTTGADASLIAIHEFADSTLAMGIGGPIQQPSSMRALYKSAVSIDRAETELQAMWQLLRTSVNKQLVATALRRFNSGIDRDRSEDAFLDFMVGIEAILTDNEPGEVTHKLSLRLAAIIGDADRPSILRDFKKLYSDRSRIAHGDRKSKSTRKRTPREAADLGRDYLRRLIRSVLEAPIPITPRLIDNRLVEGFSWTKHDN